MAIDADLNAGVLTNDEAKERREEISREADFYGAMDGAQNLLKVMPWPAFLSLQSTSLVA